MTRFFAQLFEFEREETAGETLRFQVFQAFVLGMAVYWAWVWGLDIERIPAIIAPQGIARDIDLSFLAGSQLPLAIAALVTLCAAGAWPERTARGSLTLLVVLLHVQYVARHCLGKVAHGSQYVGLGILMLTLAAWLMPSGSAQRRFALGSTLLFMGTGYMFAAFSKLFARGLAWPDGHHLWMWIAEKGIDVTSDLGAERLNLVQRLSLEHWWVATALLAGGLVTELCGMLLWFRSTRTYATVAFVGLHVGVYASLGILFDAYIVQLLIVGLPLPLLFDRGLQWRRQRRGNLPLRV